MKKILTVFAICILYFVSGSYSQTCIYNIDTTTKSIYCADSIQLHSNFYTLDITQGFSGNDLAFTDENTGYIVGLSGIIHKTNNGGASWVPLSTVTSSALTSIAFTDPSTGYACGYSGAIIKTTDAGSTWVTLPCPTTDNLLAIKFFGTSLGFAVGYNGTILKTTDAGNTWSVLSSGFTDILVSISIPDANTVYCLNPYGVILKSSNSGTSWTQITTGVNYTMWDFNFINALTGIAVGVAGKVYKTTDAGITWILQNSNTTNTLNCVKFLNDTTGIAIGENGIIIKTNDGGSHWTQQFSGTSGSLVSVCFIDTNKAYVLGYYGIKLKTINGGNNWLPLPTGISTTINSVHFPTFNIGYAAGDFGTLLKTYDEGHTWEQIYTGTPMNLKDVYFTDSITGYAIGNYGTILKTMDAGTSWSFLNCNTTNQLHSLCFTNNYTAYIAADSGRIYKTIDAGATWNKMQTSTFRSLYSVYFTNATTGYTAGKNGLIFKTTDAGNQWTQLSSGTTQNLFSISFPDSLTGYITGPYTFLKTQDAGNTWSSINATYSYGNSVFFINADTGYVADYYGRITMSVDGGQTWRILIDGNTGNLRKIFFKNSKVGYFTGSYGQIIKISDIGNANFSWQPNIGISNANSPNPFVKPYLPTDYIVTITPHNSALCGPYSDSVKVGFNAYAPTEICMVTVFNRKNLIMWNKPLSTPVDSFYIWCKTNPALIDYHLMAVKSINDTSMFIDTTSIPEIHAVKYRISILDKCGVTSGISQAHKAMFLSLSQGTGNSWNLNWSAYEGFPIMNHHLIYRGNSPDSLQQIDYTLGSSTSYIDNNPPPGIIYYQVRLISPFDCDPSKTYPTSVSNIVTNDPAYGYYNENASTNIYIGPNPATTTLTIDGLTTPTTAEIYDISGKLLLSKTLLSHSLDISDLANGLYFIKLTTAEGSIVRKFIKE